MYIRQHPYGMQIDLLGYTYKYCNLKVDYLAEKEGFELLAPYPVQTI